ncbi:MAG: terminase large subunit [Acidimicrobiia bacterium]|nr:terminase large subunit [Acidimicrobiia bacterium]
MAAKLRQPFMPWQQLVADVALEYDPDTGRMHYREVVVVVPRQQGKTTLLLVIMIFRALCWARQMIAYTAQSRNDARKKWEDEHLEILKRSPFQKGYKTRKTNGNEAVLWRNGSIHGLMASTEKSGHGPVLDLGVIDEAFAQPDDRLEQAYKPSMITKPAAQMWVVSTAGKSPAKSPFLWSKVERGRQVVELGEPSRTCYFEWSAPDDAPRGDRETWRGCMPAVGHTIDIEDVAADFESMPAAEFDRAYLCRWNPMSRESVIDETHWSAGRDPAMQMLDPVAFGIDATPDRMWASIGAAGEMRDGRVGVEVVAHDQGMGWVLDRAVRLDESHGPKCWVVDPLSPAGSLIEDLRAAGLNVVETSTADHKAAVGGFYDDATTVVELDGANVRRLAHLDQPALDAAVAGADKRNVGDAWLWGRRQSSVDISPLVAVTLARWGLLRPVDDDEAEDFVMVV